MIERLTERIKFVTNIVLFLIAIFGLLKAVRDLIYAFIETFGKGSVDFGISIGNISIPGVQLGFAGIIYVSLITILLARQQSEILEKKVLLYLPPSLLIMWAITYQKNTTWLIILLIICNLWLNIFYPRSAKKTAWLRLFDYWNDVGKTKAEIDWLRIKSDLKAGMVWMPKFPKEVSTTTRCEFNYIEKESLVLHRYLLVSLLPTNSLILIGFMNSFSATVDWGIGIGVFLTSLVTLSIAFSGGSADVRI